MLHNSRNLSGAVANQSGVMEAETILKHGRSSKSQMSRGNFFRYVCFALFTAGIIFIGCNKDDDDKDKPSKLARATVGNAEFIYQAESNGGTKSTSSGSIFYKLDKSGKVEPIQFIDENGNVLSFPIDRIIDVNSDFLFFDGQFFSLDETGNSIQYRNLLVNKKSEKIFALPNFDFYGQFSADAKGNIYGFTAGGALHKINTVDYTIENYLPEGQGGGGAFLIDKNGLCLFNNKVKHPSGKIVLLYDLIEDYNNAILGNDGFIYIFRIYRLSWEHSIAKIYRIEDINNDVKATLISEIEVNDENESLWDTYSITVNHKNNSLLFFCGLFVQINPHPNTLYEFNCTSNTWHSFQINRTSIRGSSYISKNSIYFLNREGSQISNQVNRLDLNTYEVSSITLTGFEIYQISSSITSEEISFSVLRYSDGKYLIVTVDESGNIKPIIEGNNNSKIENLIRLN